MTESLSAGTASALSPAERAALLASLRHMGLIAADAEPRLVPVSGGVSSIIARVEDGPRRLCVKRALDKLLVAEDWHVPVDRNRNEVAWMREAARALPHVVPEILGDDHVRNIFAMTWLEPRDYPVWKTELLAGTVSPAFAASVGRTLGVIHAATAGRDDVARRFATDASFHALRLEPYFETSARRNPDLAGMLTALAARTANTRRVLVHGDVSPKNILAGPSGPVFLDAECAWYGDPAFDLAFCLNHLLLKAVHRPDSAEALMAAYDALHRAYLPMVTWEEPAAVERRTADLLPALALARVDGKSPVEYLDAGARDAVRKAARGLLTAPPATLSDVQRVWGETI